MALPLEVTPPHVVQELEEAFKLNEQEAYFKCFTGLLEYSDQLKMLKDCIGKSLVAYGTRQRDKFLRVWIDVRVTPSVSASKKSSCTRIHWSGVSNVEAGFNQSFP